MNMLRVQDGCWWICSGSRMGVDEYAHYSGSRMGLDEYAQWPGWVLMNMLRVQDGCGWICSGSRMGVDEYAQGPGRITMCSWQGLELEKQILSILYQFISARQAGYQLQHVQGLYLIKNKQQWLVKLFFLFIFNSCTILSFNQK